MAAKLNLNINFNELADDVRSQFADTSGLHPGLWPVIPRMSAAAGVFAVVMLLGWFFYWSAQNEEIEQKMAQEVQLKQEYRDKMQKAINLDALKDQRALVQQYVSTMEKQLPSKAEMDALLSDINQAGIGRGLQFDSFKPGTPVVKDYYAELPIDVRLSGSYHDLGEFVADIAKLPRIVTLNNLSVSTNKDGGLTLEVVAKTFRYLDKDEVMAQANQKKAKK
jgi:type IV pilus assembly protein PilO